MIKLKHELDLKFLSLMTDFHLVKSLQCLSSVRCDIVILSRKNNKNSTKDNRPEAAQNQDVASNKLMEGNIANIRIETAKKKTKFNS